jgi:hypothetical protein
METGLKPSDRKKVHLSLTSQDAENAGKYRVPNPIILEIDAQGSIDAGNIIKHAGTTVFTTSEIPSEFIKVLNGEILKQQISPTGGAITSLSDPVKEQSNEPESKSTETEDSTGPKKDTKTTKAKKDTKTTKAKKDTKTTKAKKTTKTSKTTKTTKSTSKPKKGKTTGTKKKKE